MTKAVADHSIARTSHLEPTEIDEVIALARAAGDTDGAYPLSEHVVLHLRHGGEEPAVHLLLRTPDCALAGYAHVDTTDAVDGPSAELVVHPQLRRRGLGRALVSAVVAEADRADTQGRLRLWAHGDHPSAGALALGLGFTRARVLWQMRRSLFAPVPEPTLPEGVTLRAFRPGEDDEAWVAVNARAFAEHPDQGRWTLRDLRVRMAEPWFDPDGFLLAVRDAGHLLGFHWTKVHGDVHRHPHPDGTALHHHEPLGEVYVLGVDPSAQGLGLGAALTLAGLRHLRGRGLDQAMLYVDESNTTAIGLYTRLGFMRWSTDVSYQRRQPTGDLPAAGSAGHMRGTSQPDGREPPLPEPVPPPPDYIAFVARCAGRLHAAALELTGDDTRAAALVSDLLADAAQRWPRLRPLPGDPASRLTAAHYVGDLFRREAGAYTRIDRRGLRPPYPVAPPEPPAELAAAAWSRGRGARRRRGLVAAGLVAAAVATLLTQPGLRVRGDGPTLPDGAPVAATPSVLPRGIDLVPAPGDQLALPRLPTPLPEHITLDRPVGPLAAHPLKRALAVFRLAGSPLLLLGDDGQVRTVPESVVPIPTPRTVAGQVRLPATALSPSGTRLALPLGDELAVLDIGTGALRRFAMPESPRFAVWLGPDWLVAGGEVTSTLIDARSGRANPSTLPARTALAPQGTITGPSPAPVPPYDLPPSLGPATAAPTTAAPTPGTVPPGRRAGTRRPAPPTPFDVPGAIELLAVGEPDTAPARVRRHVPTPKGVLPLETALRGDLAGWIGPWRGPGFLTRDWAVRDFGVTGPVPARYGTPTTATAVVDPATGDVHRVLLSTNRSAGQATQVLGGLGTGQTPLGPGAILVRAPGESGTVNLLAWQAGVGRLYLVSTIDRSPAIALADLSRIG